MRKLLREMVTTTTDYISTSSTSAGDFTTTASKATKTSLWSLDQSLIETNGRIKAHTSQMVIKVEVRARTCVLVLTSWTRTVHRL